MPVKSPKPVDTVDTVDEGDIVEFVESLSGEPSNEIKKKFIEDVTKPRVNEIKCKIAEQEAEKEKARTKFQEAYGDQLAENKHKYNLLSEEKKRLKTEIAHYRFPFPKNAIERAVKKNRRNIFAGFANRRIDNGFFYKITGKLGRLISDKEDAGGELLRLKNEERELQVAKSQILRPFSSKIEQLQSQIKNLELSPEEQEAFDVMVRDYVQQQNSSIRLIQSEGQSIYVNADATQLQIQQVGKFISGDDAAVSTPLHTRRIADNGPRLNQP